jgi:hypothetical protein
LGSVKHSSMLIRYPGRKLAFARLCEQQKGSRLVAEEWVDRWVEEWVDGGMGG